MRLAGEQVPGEASPVSQIGYERYIPSLLYRRVTTSGDSAVETLAGTFVFVDVSGFTKLSERLQKIGREGAELLVDAINRCFTALLADVHLFGGSLVKFGGDALLLWFEGDGHQLRGCVAAATMRQTLREVGRLNFGASKIVLRMSVGVHSGAFHTFLVGDLFRDLIIAGPAATTLIGLESTADANQILISPETAAALPARCLGSRLGPGLLLAHTPAQVEPAPLEAREPVPADLAAQLLPPQVFTAVSSGEGAAEHRTATVAFLEYRDFDTLIEAEGASEAARRLDALVRLAQREAAKQSVCLIDTDIGGNGGKLRFTAGAPIVVGDDEERMLLTLRGILDEADGLPIRAGVNRGPVFTGEVGPAYRRTYVVMGDTVNLAARVMGKAEPGSMLSTAGALDRSQTKFQRTEVPAFLVKGKKKPITAWKVGAPQRATAEQTTTQELPLLGREREITEIRKAIDQAAAGRGCLVELVGEAGSGKSRLMSEARKLMPDANVLHTTCGVYATGIPYAAWRQPLRQLLGISWAATGPHAGEVLTEHLAAVAPKLLRWAPLLAIPFEAEVSATPEVDALSLEVRTARLHTAVLTFLLHFAQEQTLFEVEHSQLMDAASAALMRAVEPHLADSRWLVMSARRDQVSGFVAAEDSVSVELGPLSDEVMTALAESTPAAHVVPQRVLEDAVSRAGGSPEFLFDLLLSAASHGGAMPDSLEAATTARIDSLDPDDRVLVRRASVLGVSFFPRRLEAVLDGVAVPTPEVWSRLGDVFEQDPDGQVRFKRPALRDVAYSGLPFKTRRALHASLAAAIEAGGGTDLDADPSVLSLHFSAAGDAAAAYRYALIAAKRATGHYALGDAVELYRRAIEAARGLGVDAVELARTWEELGETLNRTGERRDAVASFQAARRLVGGDPLDDARLMAHIARTAASGGATRSTVRWASRCLRAIEGMPGEEAARLRASALSTLGVARYRAGHLEDAVATNLAAITAAEMAGERHALGIALNTLDAALLKLGRVDEAVHAVLAVEVFRDLGDREEEANALNMIGISAYYRGEWDEAIDYYRQCAETCAKAGNRAMGCAAEVNVGELLADQGHYGDARGHLLRAERMFSSMGETDGALFARTLLARLSQREGDLEEAVSLLERVIADSQGLGMTHSLATAVMAEIVAAVGAPTSGLELAATVPYENDPVAAVGHRARAIALMRLGDLTAAEAAVRVAIDTARSLGLGHEVVASFAVLDAIAGLTEQEIAERDILIEQLGLVAVARPWQIGGESLAAQAAREMTAG